MWWSRPCWDQFAWKTSQIGWSLGIDPDSGSLQMNAGNLSNTSRLLSHFSFWFDWWELRSDLLCSISAFLPSYLAYRQKLSSAWKLKVKKLKKFSQVQGLDLVWTRTGSCPGLFASKIQPWINSASGQRSGPILSTAFAFSLMTFSQPR